MTKTIFFFLQYTFLCNPVNFFILLMTIEARETDPCQLDYTYSRTSYQRKAEEKIQPDGIYKICSSC